jgi:hypothetical protein
MSITRLTEIKEGSRDLPIRLILDNTYTFPYTLTGAFRGLIIKNSDAATALEITLSNRIVFSVPAGEAFDDVFLPFTTIDTSGSTSYQIGVR